MRTAAGSAGSFAFFKGSSAQYEKALKLSDSIAGYKVMDISHSAVKLNSGTNNIELAIGSQMRREDQGPWTLSADASPILASPSSSSSSGTGSKSLDC